MMTIFTVFKEIFLYLQPTPISSARLPLVLPSLLRSVGALPLPAGQARPRSQAGRRVPQERGWGMHRVCLDGGGQVGDSSYFEMFIFWGIRVYVGSSLRSGPSEVEGRTRRRRLPRMSSRICLWNQSHRRRRFSVRRSSQGNASRTGRAYSKY